MSVLSPTMQACVDYMKANGGVILRYQGGFWAKEGWYLHNGVWFSTPTIQALVKRGYAQYDSWKQAKNGAADFPVSACLVQPPHADEAKHE